MSRFLAQKFGKWKDLVCAVKKAESAKLQYLYFAQKLNKETKNSGR